MPPAGEGAGSSASPKRSPSATVGGDTAGGGGDGGTGGGDANLSSTPASPFTIAGSTTSESAPVPGSSFADSTDSTPPFSPPPLVLNPVSLAAGVGVCVGPVPSISVVGPRPSPTSLRLSELAVARLNLSAVPSQSAGEAPNRLSVPTGSLLPGLGDTTVANPSPGTATRFAAPGLRRAPRRRPRTRTLVVVRTVSLVG